MHITIITIIYVSQRRWVKKGDIQNVCNLQLTFKRPIISPRIMEKGKVIRYK